MKKALILVAAVLLVLIVAAAIWLWYLMRQPLYRPGVVREETSLRAPLAPPPPGDTPDMWRVEEDVLLHHFEVGDGPPVLVVHGGPGRPIAAPLAALAPLTARHRFIYYDQRGCGRSTRPVRQFASKNFMANVKELDGAVGIAAQIADLERIRRLLGADRLVLLGHSFGGFLAALYAAEFPNRVERMVLVAPADLLVFPAKDDGLFGAIGRRLSDARKIDFDDFLDDYLDFSSLFTRDEAELQAWNVQLGHWYVEACRPRVVPAAALGDPEACGGWAVQGAYFSMGLQHDYTDALSAVQAPVLVLHGTEDLQPARGSRSYVEALPDARLVTIEGAGHFLLFEENEAVAKVIGDFLDPADG